MLKKLLPINKKQKKQKAQEPKKEELLSPNLLDLSLYSADTLTTIKQRGPRSAIPAIVVVIIITHILVLTVTILHHLTNTELISLRKNIIELSAEIETYSNLEKQTVDIIDKTELYKKVKNESHMYHPKIDHILEQTPENITIKEITLSKKTAQISVQTDKALNIAQMITEYFENDLIKNMVIKTAVLRPNKNIFLAELEVNFK